MIKIDQIKIPISSPQDQALKKRSAKILGIREEYLRHFEILRRSIDARKKSDIKYVYNVALVCPQIEERLRLGEKIKNVSLFEKKEFEFPYADTSFRIDGPNPKRPVIIGAGPAGLFAAIELTLAGIPPIIIERGKPVDQRLNDVKEFWETGVLKPDSNVQFGEGGAGTFSDGKLNTLIKDRDGSMRYVLETFVEFGAPEEILYDYKPHIGTDMLMDVIRNMRQWLISRGCDIRFNTTLTGVGMSKGRIFDIEVETYCDNEGRPLANPIADLIFCDHVILAIGHSARDTFKMLYEKGVPMEAKEFAVGLRIEHPRAFIDEHQFGHHGAEILGAAPYKLATKLENGRGVYSFCMCPGGYVVNSSSEAGHLVVNGMSYARRDGENSNSAIVVSVGPDEYDMSDPLSGVEYQRSLEKRAYELGNGRIPQQHYGDFKKKIKSGSMGEISDENFRESLKADAQKTEPLKQKALNSESFCSATKGMSAPADLTELFSDEINSSIVEGMEIFDSQMQGFAREDAILSGVESRTSSPVRIPRDDTFQSDIRGLFPCGEGAGYAGGITSAAMDGLKVARALIYDYNGPFH